MARAGRRFRLSKKDIKKLINNIKLQYNNFNISKNDIIEYAKINDIEFYIINNIPTFFILSDGKLAPVLVYLIKRGYDWLPRVMVDRGATRAVGKGADLMVPGIRDLDEFEKESIVVIIDEDTGVPVAVGRALMSSEEIRERLSGSRRGKAVKNIHYPGDKIWKIAKDL